MMRRAMLVFLSLLIGGLAEVLEETVVPPNATLLVEQGQSSAVLDKAYAVGDALPDPDVKGANVTSVFGLMVDLMGKELRSGSKINQLATAGASLVLGCIMLWDGLHVFEIFILIITFVAVYILMMGNFQTSEYTGHLGDGAKIWEKILSLEVAILIVFTFKFSIGLVKKFLGLGLGIFAFLWVQSFLVSLAAQHEWEALNSAATSPAYFIGSALVFFPASVWLFAEGPSYVFAILAPIFGSIMVTSSLFFFATFFDHNSCVECPPKHAWIDFVVFLLGTGKAGNIGPLQGVQLGIPINQWAMWSVAIVLCVIFLYKQISMAKEEKASRGGTFMDKLMGCLTCNRCSHDAGGHYESLLASQKDQIRDLEQRVRASRG